MKRGSEEFLSHSDYTFSLRPTAQRKSTLAIFHDFSPFICQKTFKLISSVPSYHSQCTLPFQTEVDLPKSILKNEAEKSKISTHILVPRPNTQYCQICEEGFEDYLKHTSHPLHIRKVRQRHNELNFNSLKDIMIKRYNKNSRDTALLNKETARVYSSPAKTCSKDGGEEKFSERYSTGSKKRIVLNHEGDLQVISLISSTKMVQTQAELSSQKSIRKFSISKHQKL